jgi:hypothetical protein
MDALERLNAANAAWGMMPGMGGAAAADNAEEAARLGVRPRLSPRARSGCGGEPLP